MSIKNKLLKDSLQLRARALHHLGPHYHLKQHGPDPKSQSISANVHSKEACTGLHCSTCEKDGGQKPGRWQTKWAAVAYLGSDGSEDSGDKEELNPSVWQHLQENGGSVWGLGFGVWGLRVMA